MGGLSRSAAEALAAILCVAFPAAGQELLANGSFEIVDQAGVPVGWSADFPKIEGQEPARFMVDAQQFTDGTRSACVANANPDSRDFNNLLAKVESVPPGAYVQLSGKVRTRHVSGAAFVMLQFWEVFEKGRYRLPHRSTEVRLDELRDADWRPFELTAFVPTGTTLATVRCGIIGTGAAWFDELSLRPADPPAPGMGENLLKNGGAEEGDGAAPLGWTTFGPFDEGTRFAWATDARHAGARSLAIAADEGQAFRWWEQWVPVLPGPGQYRLSGWVRTEGLPDASRAMLILDVYGDTGEQIAMVRTLATADDVGSQEWTQVTAVLQVGEDARCARVLAFLGGPGRAWFDDIELVAAP